ncbi:MAG: tetratricopeptide repeat protein, partial [Mycobacterium sp.]|nr:tetratricopeptide repeat protein [Mycobacterium sp.]
DGFQPTAWGDLAAAFAQVQAGQRMLWEVGDQGGVGLALAALTALSVVAGRLDDAEDYAEEHLALARRIGDQRSTAQVHEDLAVVALSRDDHDRAAELLGAALVMSTEVGHMELVAHVVKDLAVVAAHQEPAHAARLFGAGEALREEVGTPTWPPRRMMYAQALATVRDVLGQVEFDAAWAEGRVMTPERAITYALQYVNE